MYFGRVLMAIYILLYILDTGCALHISDDDDDMHDDDMHNHKTLFWLNSSLAFLLILVIFCLFIYAFLSHFLPLLKY